ncbi:permease [Brenneria goodwinii]|uniref:Probable membrane transporter protein n=1 Tax=Brenneria goodwinii TaxID=1109412 RepID=A0AAE8JPF4_9GAMM|nr:sulfite exporter TauE/SafE family protein [Brenneria goodwinii]ATA26228.1 permease [Brenneria goodwinii]MCG8157045.1 sulfite exporter TauE/SafE family protein [Brenneria goodwinii]MCG8161396.1 sulfite exporter TauE/SafE family protein [Brenneria goodwinii]MCG8167073.1 sulfite exporter TauE/SafE family protein [Brenneria goodwinii]MCG8171732.1 sulfite exporter TauE/SafE family protein [Brenneria goodwinii]
MPNLIPPEISPLFAGVLVFCSFLTSALTAALGLGGGVTLLAIMGLGMPVSSLLPVHGIVQFGSNLSRTLIQRLYIAWPLVLWFFIGSVAGIALGAPVAVWIPDGIAKIALALFILWSVFHTRPPAKKVNRLLFILGGAVASIGTMIVGATGPLVAGLISSQGLSKQPLIATHATCMVLQHGLKILAFGLMGFAYASWLPMLGAMIASGVLGTWLGARLLDNLPEKLFRTAFRLTMMILCSQLIWQGIQGYL